MLSHVAERYVWKWLAEDVTENSCAKKWRFLVGWCLAVQAKGKLIAWKNSWIARFTDKHSKALTSPPLMKNSINNSNTLSVSFMFISWHLKKFYEYKLGFWELHTQMYPWISRTLDFWLQSCEKKSGLYMDVYSNSRWVIDGSSLSNQLNQWVIDVINE